MDELLLDSSYLFPLFGIKLEYKNFEAVFPSSLSQRFVVKYNPVSLIEAKWYVLRESKKKREHENLVKSYRTGLSSLQRDKRLESTLLTNERIEELSDSLLATFEVKDYFDRIIYSTAANLQCTFLTEDDQLHNLFDNAKNNLMKPKEIKKWKDILPSL